MNTCPAHSTACQSGVIGVFLVVCCLMNQDFARVHCVANHDGALKLKRFLYEVAEDGLGIHEMQKAFDDNAAVNKSIDPARKLKKLAQSVKKILDDAKKAVKKLKKSFEEEFEKFSRTHNPWKLCTSLQIQDLKWDDFTKNYVRNEACEIQAPNEKNASAFWYITKNVIDKAKNNKKELQNLILWQYWADKNGLLTIYPALKKQTSHDPRTRPWYRQAASTGGKSIVILLDRSRSMMNVLDLAKHVAMTLLELLNPEDEVGVVHFSKYASPVCGCPQSSECYCENLAINTPHNRRCLQDAIKNIRQVGIFTNYTAALGKAFELLKPHCSQQEEKECLIFLISDGEPQNLPKDFIESQNGEMGNKVVFYSCGVGVVSNESRNTLGSLANQTFINSTLGERRSGELLVFTDYDQVVTKLVQIFRYPKNINPQWSLPYVDNLGAGIVMTVSVPLLVNGSFQGVVALDVFMETLFQGVSFSQLADTSYAFLIDVEGRTLSHPLLPKPRTVDQGQLFVDISDLETDKAVESIIQSMKHGGNGSKQVNATRVIAHGHVESEGVTNISMASSYYWTAVEGSQYSVCIVSTERDTKLRLEDNISLDSFLYHRIDKYIPDNMQICQHFGIRAVKSNSAVQFSSTSWEDPLDHKKQVETKKSIEDLTKYMLTGDNKPLNNGFILKDDVRDEVIITAMVEKFWTNHSSYSDILVWRSVATRNLIRFYPAGSITGDFDSTKRPWFQRALTARDKLVLSPPYLDSWASNQVILTLSKAIFKGRKEKSHSPSGPVAAVMECDFRIQYFGEKLKTFFPECSDGDCFIMQTSGFLVWHPAFEKKIHSFNHSGIPSNHVIVVEPCVALSMMKDKIINSTKCMDVEKLLIRFHLRVHFDPKITNEKYTLYEVEGTNLFVVTNYSKANKNCTCDTQTELCKIWDYVKYSGSPYVTSLDDFDLCENRLQYSSRNKYLPCTPHVNDNTRKVPRHDVIKDLPLCFDPGCQKKKNKSTCSIFPACEWREKEAFRREMCVSFLDKDPVLENDVAFLLYSVSASFCFVFVAVVCFLVVQKSCRKKAISKQSTHSTSSCHENPAFSEDSRDSCEDLYLSSNHPETTVKTRKLSSNQPSCNVNSPHISYSTQKLLFTCPDTGLIPVEDSVTQSFPFSSVPQQLHHLHASIPLSHKCLPIYSSSDSQSNSLESNVCPSELMTVHHVPVFECTNSLRIGSLPKYNEIEKKY